MASKKSLRILCAVFHIGKHSIGTKRRPSDKLELSHLVSLNSLLPKSSLNPAYRTWLQPLKRTLGTFSAGNCMSRLSIGRCSGVGGNPVRRNGFGDPFIAFSSKNPTSSPIGVLTFSKRHLQATMAKEVQRVKGTEPLILPDLVPISLDITQTSTAVTEDDQLDWAEHRSAHII